MTDDLSRLLDTAADTPRSTVDGAVIRRRVDRRRRTRTALLAGLVALAVAVPSWSVLQDRPTAVILDRPAATASPIPAEDPGGDADPAVLRPEWRLREVTADGRHVALVVEHGSCDGYLGPRVTEDGDDAVVIEIAYDPPEGVVACDGVGLNDREVVALPTPLDGRVLTGCGVADCLAAPEEAGFDGRGGGVAVAAGVAAVVVDDGVVGLDVDGGHEVWRIPHDVDADRYREDPTAFADLVLLVDQSAGQDVIAVDAATGETRWQAAGRSWYGYLREQVTPPDAADPLVLLSPTAGLVETDDGPQGGVVEARRPDGSVAWTAPVPGLVFEIDVTGTRAVVLSGRNMDAAEQLGDTVVTVLDLATGAVRWQTPLPGQAYDAVLRPELGDGGIVVVNVLGAVYGLSLADGAEVWRNVPFNYGGMIDVGPAVLLRPGQYGDPHLLVDPATGSQLGAAGQPGNTYGLDVSLYPRLDGQVILPQPGQLVRRDVTTIPLTEPDPTPVWAADLFAQAGPPTLTAQRTVIVPTPLGARAHDVATGELRWSFADLP